MAPALVILLSLLGPPAAAGGDGASLSIAPGRDRGSYRIHGSFQVEAPGAVAWDVLTDYDGMARFVSSLRSSRVLEHRGKDVVIEQEGSARFLFLSRSVTLTLAVKEQPQDRLDFKALKDSPFERYEGTWTITPSSGSCRVTYELTAKPGPSLGPRFAVKSVLKKNARRQLNEVRAEIKRRAGRPP